MRKDSLFVAITAVFIILFFVMTFAFYQLFQNDRISYEAMTQKRYMQVSEIIKRESHHIEIAKRFKEYFDVMDFAVDTNVSRIKSVIEDPEVTVIEIENLPDLEILQLLDKNSRHMLVQTATQYMLLSDKLHNTQDRTKMIFIFLAILGLFGFFYLYTIQKLYPLKKLQRSVRLLGREEYDIDCASDKKDEISLLANEFDKSAKKLKHLREARNVFIRNIMHELKTPITKGKFLTELPQSPENQEKMKELFYRLESLISEFATIESLISNKQYIEKQSCYLDDVVDNAIDMLMCDEDQVVRSYENITLQVDYRLFSIAMKNLIDNAIKYATSHMAIITSNRGRIEVRNIGKPFEHPLEAYFEPFFKGDEESFNQSFGLGLYIVKHIVDAHGFSISYVHENEMNIISIGYKDI